MAEIWKKQWVKIRMGESQSNCCLVYFKNDMTIDFYFRWRWYFKYLAASCQVQNPKFYIEFTEGSYDFVPEKQQVAKRLKDRIIAKKARITSVKKEWKEIKENWNSLFPIETHPKYQATIDKINQLCFELRTMEDEYKDLTT